MFSPLFIFFQVTTMTAPVARASAAGTAERSHTLLRPLTARPSGRPRVPTLPARTAQLFPNWCRQSIRSCSPQEPWSCQVENKSCKQIWQKNQTETEEKTIQTCWSLLNSWNYLWMYDVKQGTCNTPWHTQLNLCCASCCSVLLQCYTAMTF